MPNFTISLTDGNSQTVEAESYNQNGDFFDFHGAMPDPYGIPNIVFTIGKKFVMSIKQG